MTDLVFGLVEEEIEERNKAVFQHARTLIRDSFVLSEALSPLKNPRTSQAIGGIAGTDTAG